MRLLTASLVLTLALLGCASERQPETAPSQAKAPVQVRTAEVVERDYAQPIEVVGTLRAKRTVSVSSRLLSVIHAIHAEEGDRVAPGRLLIELDDRELVSALQAAQAARSEAQSAIQALQSNLESAQAQLELAELTFRRYQELRQKDSVTQQEYDEADARVRSARSARQAILSQQEQARARQEQAQARIASAQVSLGYARIASPVRGIVTQRLEDPGSMAVPGKPILQIEESDSYRLELAVPESLLSALRVGQALASRIDALDEIPSQRKIVEISPEVDPASRTFIVKLALETHPSLRSGLYGRAFVNGPQRQVLLAPAEAIVRNGQVRSVYVVEDGIARVRLVTLGELIEGSYEVLSGLQAGDLLVLSPDGLSDGARVILSDSSPIGNGEGP